MFRLKKTKRNKRAKKRPPREGPGLWGRISARVRGEAPSVVAQLTGKRSTAAAAATAPAPGAPRGVDLFLLGGVLSLLGLGLVMVYSSSAVFAATRYNDQLFFIKRDLVYVSAGLIALYAGWRLDVVYYKRYAIPLLLGTLLALAMLHVPGLGTRVDGAVRWFRIAGVSIQPSEPAKLTLIIFLAAILARKRETVRLFSVGFLPPLLIAGFLSGLVLIQPDLGTAAVLGGVTLVMLFVAGTKLSYLLITTLACAPIAYNAIVGTPWRLRRLLAFLDPIGHRHDAGYQIYESFLSLGSGGLMGQGLGAGKQKLLYLPAAHTDFILAQVGEELGFIGLIAVVLIYGLIMVRGIRAALGARDLFSTYLAFGITTVVTLQALLHMCVVLGLVPTKGITLPLMSFGGSALISTCFCMGVMLNVSARNPVPVPPKLKQKTGQSSNRKARERVVVVQRSTNAGAG